MRHCGEIFTADRMCQRVPVAPSPKGPGDDATVEGLRLGDGTAEAVQVVGRRVAREDAPVVDRLDIDLRGVAFDRSTRRLTRVESARGTARLLSWKGTRKGLLATGTRACGYGGR